MQLNCLLLHNWANPWKPVWDEHKTLTGYYYRKCAEPGCQKVKIVWNGEKPPEK